MEKEEKMKPQKKFRHAVFIVAYKLEKQEEKNIPVYLLLKRKLHWKGWEFPKGKIEKGENKAQAAKRETMEETGLKVIKLKSYNVSGKYFYKKLLPDRPNIMGQTYTLFSAELKDSNKKPKLDKKEHSGYKWAEYKQAIKLLTWPNQKKCLKIVNRKIK